MEYTATYSPDDNKLRLYAVSRLDAETYARVKAAGFRWAPKQELFVAPAWTPEREDLLVELAGEVGDEDTSLTERAEERAERFEDYSDKRWQDAERAHKAVAAISEHIPLGQPILIGHHSEKHARRDAARIENGMRHAVKMWETSKYWTSRAAGALHHAKYKELPAVRARRIKGLEADKRKIERSRDEAQKTLDAWRNMPATPAAFAERARILAGFGHFGLVKNEHGSYWTAYDVLRPDGERYKACPSWTPEQVQTAVIEMQERYLAPGGRSERWLMHYENRLAYERAMLAESGGLVSDRQKFEVGGRIRRRGEWLVIIRVNAQSVSVAGHWQMTVSHDEIQEYQPPTAEATAAAKKVTKLAPLCNYPGEGFAVMTEAEYKAIPRWSDFPYIQRVKATETHGAHRIRQRPGAQHWKSIQVYLTDVARKDPPPPADSAEKQATRAALAPERVIQPPREPKPEAPQSELFEAMKDTLKAGVQVVTAPQLFPTPPDLAARMVELADIQPGDRVLEPSSGTGAILKELPTVQPNGSVTAVEISQQLAALAEPYADTVVRADFLQCGHSDLGQYDRILMNPPFVNAADIEHIQHALKFLKPGGRLVAICANGPRQRERLMPLAHTWEDLPPGTFKDSGTNVNTALLTMEG